MTAKSGAEQMATVTKQAIHFFKGDERFCGFVGTHRFTLDPNEVTCPRCCERDTFTLSPQGAAYVATLKALS